MCSKKRAYVQGAEIEEEATGAVAASMQQQQQQPHHQGGASHQYGAPPPQQDMGPFSPSPPQPGPGPVPLSSRPPQPQPSSYDGFPDDDMLGGNSGGGLGSGGNRWPREETLALIRIRSEMDATFRDATLKSPLWEEVSR